MKTKRKITRSITQKEMDLKKKVTEFLKKERDLGFSNLILSEVDRYIEIQTKSQEKVL